MYVNSPYNSSETTIISWRFNTSQTASKSSRPITAPVGLFGKFIKIAFVFGVITASKSSGVIRNWFSSFNGRITGVPSAIVTAGTYET